MRQRDREIKALPEPCSPTVAIFWPVAAQNTWIRQLIESTTVCVCVCVCVCVEHLDPAVDRVHHYIRM